MSERLFPFFKPVSVCDLCALSGQTAWCGPFPGILILINLLLPCWMTRLRSTIPKGDETSMLCNTQRDNEALAHEDRDLLAVSLFD